MKELTEIRRETYGHDSRAINQHSERWYRNSAGKLYVLSLTLDGCPPFFEAYGPFGEDHEGLLPRLLVDGQEYWGDGWSWTDAFEAMKEATDGHNDNERR
ncbi:MAG: hypothetical protein HOJ57_37275 [Lentisphaerae bacterium]|jgi:hypothetical protein|nr:hypothetical protein [Lentisphaerota bacterium]MBT5611652.1 hypothetical protein [Lentisphaerota bacterium]